MTFPRPGNHSIVAGAVTTGGTLISSRPRKVHVAAAGPPVFTVVSPADGSVVNLDEGGGQVTVQLTTTIDQYFPLSVSIICDGQTTTEQFTGTQYQKTVILAPMPLGPRIISVACADPDHRSSTSSRSVVGQDVGAPHLQVGFPQRSANVIGDANGAVTVPVHGTAADNQSGMAGGSAAAAWALAPGGPWMAAHPATGSDFSNWSAEVSLAGFGAHTIFVRATDQAGNTTPVSVPVTVISSYVPSTLEDRLSEREYLAALLSFAQEQVTVPGTPPAPLDTGTLAGALGQPVDRLSQPLSAAADRGGREVNQLRVPVELLRVRIAAAHTATGPGAAGESSYRSAAYAALLAAYRYLVCGAEAGSGRRTGGPPGPGRPAGDPVRAENPIRGCEQQSCSSSRSAAMIASHVPAVRLPPDRAGDHVAPTVPTRRSMEDRRDLDPAPPARRSAAASDAPPESELGRPGPARDIVRPDTESAPQRAAAAGHPGHDPALAPRHHPPPLGGQVHARQDRPPGGPHEHPSSSAPASMRESRMGVSQDPRRAGRVGSEGRRVNRMGDPEGQWRRPRAAADRADLAAIPTLPGRRDPGLRLLHSRSARRHPGPRPSRDRARDPADSHPRSHAAPNRGMDQPAGPQPNHGLRRTGRADEVHDPRPGI